VKLGRVAGTVVSTINAPAFDGRTLLLCDLLDPAGKPAGGYLIAIDTVGAGPGETVLILDEGTSARQVLGAPGAPIRTVIVGIVDAVTGDDPGTTEKPGTPRAITGTAAPKEPHPKEPHPKEPRRRRHGGTRSDADHG
jgi:ethanolamine utilization protein EutN